MAQRSNVSGEQGLRRRAPDLHEAETRRPPVRIRPPPSNRLSFITVDTSLEDCNVDLTVSLAYGSIKLTTPIYFDDMSFGALSGIPNVVLAKTADLTETLTGTV